MDDDSNDFENIPQEQWNWKLLIRTPDFVEDEDLENTIKRLLDKGKNPVVREVKLESLSEGLCVQALHLSRVWNFMGCIMKYICRILAEFHRNDLKQFYVFQ